GVWPSSTVAVRIPAQTGPWMYLARQQSSPPYWGTQDASGNLVLTLQVPFQGGAHPAPAPNAVEPTDSNASCEVQLGNDLLPFHQPILFPSGVVIDLDQSSPNVAGLWPATPVTTSIDIMFSARGNVSGAVSALGPFHFLLNSLTDASQ